MKFLSDNTAGATPEVLEALRACNAGVARAYGADDWSARLDNAFSAWFGHAVRVFPVVTGTAANALSLATLTPPWGEVLATDEAHVIRDECGACELQGGGLRLTGLPSVDGRLEPAVLQRHLVDNPASVHTVQPAALTLTQATECGTVYTPAQLAALAAIAHGAGLRVHLDGARFANAVAGLGVPPADITWRAGIDVLSFGATKNGAIGAEAVVFFDAALAATFELRRKRAGHLLSKMRYVSAQLLACVEGAFFLANARRANALAARIGAAAGPRLLHPVEANAVFLRLPGDGRERLRAAGFEFYDWGPPRLSAARLVVSWDQPESDVEQLCGALRAWS